MIVVALAGWGGPVTLVLELLRAWPSRGGAEKREKGSLSPHMLARHSCTPRCCVHCGGRTFQTKRSKVGSGMWTAAGLAFVEMHRQAKDDEKRLYCLPSNFVASGWVRKLLYSDLQVEKVANNPFSGLRRTEWLKTSHNVFNHTGISKIRYLPALHTQMHTAPFTKYFLGTCLLLTLFYKWGTESND